MKTLCAIVSTGLWAVLVTAPARDGSVTAGPADARPQPDTGLGAPDLAVGRPTSPNEASQVKDEVDLRDVVYEAPTLVTAYREVEILLDGTLTLEQIRALPDRAVDVFFPDSAGLSLGTGPNVR